MSLLDNIKQMQQQGMNDADIAQSLKEQGMSPMEIDDAINQSKIKAAVYEDTGANAIMNNEQNGGMQQSMMTQELPPDQPPQQQQEGYYQPQQYPQEGYYQPQSGVSPDAISEIAEQIVAEKMSEIRKSIGNIAEFKTTVESRIASMDERLKKIETMIDKLQMSILNKIGTYSESIQGMREEMGAMQDSFSKVINPLVGRAKERRNQQVKEEPVEEPKVEEPREEEQQETPNRKRADGFESFLR